MVIKTIKLNKFHEKLLGAALFINADLIARYVTTDDTHLNIEIEQVEAGILIRPLKAVELLQAVK